MATQDEIRAKDILPHKTSLASGDGFYGDGNSSFFMEANVLLRETAENAQSDKKTVPYDKVWGYVKNDGSFVPGPDGGTYISSDFIPVSGGDVLSIGYSGSNSVLGISGYSSTSQSSYISGFKRQGDESFHRESVLIPDAVTHIRITYAQTIAGDYNLYVQSPIYEKFDEVEESLNGIQKLAGENIPYGLHSGYVKSDGTISASSNIDNTYFYSDFIPVSEGDVLSVGFSGSSSVLGISGYSSASQSTYVSNFKWAGEGGYSRKEITIPSCVAYIRVTFNTTFSGDYHVYRQTELSELPKVVEKEITDIKEMKGDAVPYSVNVGYVKNDGTIVEQSLPAAYRYSDFIAVEEGITYSIAFSGSPSVMGLSGYATADQSDIVSSFEFLGENGHTRYAVKIPSGVHYIRITYNLGYDGDYTMYAPNGLTALKESVDKLSLGVNVSYEDNLKKYAPITPKKACIMFEMDCNANGVNSHLDEYADTLEQYGIKRSTFFPHSDLMDGSNPLYVSIMQRMQARGNEVSIHSVADDGIGQTDTTPAPTLSQFETIMQGYVSGFEGVGLAPIGWVTSRGTIHSEFREPLRKWIAYGHTLANKTAYPNFNVSTYVNDTDTDRLNILRIGLEYSAGEGETQADVDAEMLQCAKDAVDYAVANGGLVVFYAHSYKTTTIPYTMRAEVLEPLLAYIKTYIDKHLVVSGTGAEVCKYYFG